MVFNPEFFSYGVGLPLVGWGCGMVIGFVFSMMRGR